jgi:hypothetical protein
MPKYHELINQMFESLDADEAGTLIQLLKKLRVVFKRLFFYTIISNSR